MISPPGERPCTGRGPAGDGESANQPRRVVGRLRGGAVRQARRLRRRAHDAAGQQVCEDCQVIGFFSDSQSAVICYGHDRLVRQHLSTGAPTEILSVAPAAILDARLSPDDRWAHRRRRSGPSVEIAVAPVGPPAPGPVDLAPDRRRSALIRSGLVPPGMPTRATGPPARPGRPTATNSTTSATATGTCASGPEAGSEDERADRGPVPAVSPASAGHLAGPVGQGMFLAAARDRLILPECTVTSNLWTAMLEPAK